MNFFKFLFARLHEETSHHNCPIKNLCVKLLSIKLIENFNANLPIFLIGRVALINARYTVSEM